MFPRVLLAFLWLAGTLAAADIAPPDAAAIAKELDALELKQKQGKDAEKAAALAQIQSAAASGSAAEKFYSDAVEAVQFKGKKDKVEAYLEWKKARADLLRSREMQTALTLHLRYLLLSLQRKGLEKPSAQVAALLTYVNDLVASDKLFADQKPPTEETRALLEKPLAQSVFVQWLRLGEWLPEEKSWEQKPGDFSGILEKNIRPLLREQKDAQVVGTWDLELKVVADRITGGHSDFQAEQFNSVTRPRLLFKRAQDMVLVGQPNKGVAEMVALAKASPTHPDFPAWVAKIRELIKTPVQTSPQ